jgi:Patatin-like phospholipase
MSADGPFHGAAAFDDELRKLRPEIRAATPGTQPRFDDLVQLAHAQELTAVCLSGGGVRSASFALGVIEGLCRRGWLEHVDYLSTVSGGGYAGGWLSAWRHHAAAANETVGWPASPRQPGGPAEPESLTRLRRYSRYLAPHAGALSVDLWALLATIARNMLLMWLVLIPMLAALLLVPYMYFGAVRALERDLVNTEHFTLGESSTWLLIACCALFALSIGFIVRDLPSLGGRRGTQRAFLTWCLAPLCLGALGLTLFWATDTVPVTFGYAVASAALAHPLTWVVAGLRTPRRWRPRTWIAAATSAMVAVGGMEVLATGSFGFGHPLEYDYATLAFPFVLGLVAVATVLQIGLSREETADEDLEWWSRFGAWLLLVIVSWIAATAVVLLGPLAMKWVAEEVLGLLHLPGGGLSAILGMLTSVTGGIAALVARSGQGESRSPGTLDRIVRAAVTPAFIVLLLTFLASANLDVMRTLHYGHLSAGISFEGVLERAWMVEALILFVALAGVGLLMAVLVPVNKYSLHGMYRNRLIRAFVGASRPHAARRPSPFTDFDPDDDLPMAGFAALPGPLRVVNTTLNLVSEGTLALQQRKSEAFTISPLHAGSWTLGYRPSNAYACERHASDTRGISLGTAVTISGAAASPNMGAGSTPALTFLLTLFNARLGAWLGNPGPAGHATWQHPDPRLGPVPVLRELFGLTNDRSPYVFLSDGGHFENLGLYEMVRRRCHCIIVSDAGCDPGYTFQDLSNAVRKIRIDFSIPIEFPPDGLGMSVAGQGKGNPHLAIGTIRYSVVDGPVANGVLIYMKATLSGDEPVDVLNYARSHPVFPHESTANQFFTEAQFESYRMLGLHTLQQAAELPIVRHYFEERAGGSWVAPAAQTPVVGRVAMEEAR